MKKPDITKGEWRIGKYRPYNQVVVTQDRARDNDAHPGHRKICSINNNEQQKANAKAISAVPEMIDVLLNIEKDNGSIPDEVWKTRNDALKKAGCKK